MNELPTDNQQSLMEILQAAWSFDNSGKSAFSKESKMSRKIFWINTLYYGTIFSLLAWCAMPVFPYLEIGHTIKVILGIVFVLFLIEKLIVWQVQRLHDIGKSGWWVIIIILPIVHLLLLYWYLQKGKTIEPTIVWKQEDLWKWLFNVLMFTILIICGIYINSIL